MKAKISVEMPFLGMLSVNHCYRRGNPRYGKLPEVEGWLWRFKTRLRVAFGPVGPPIGNVRMDITINRPPKPGRRPDPSNFRKTTQDLAASVLEVDDACFYGTDYPLQLTKKNGDGTIRFDFEWLYDPTQPWTAVHKPGGRKLFKDDSLLHNGPMNKTLFKLFKVGPEEKENLCIGFGSAYCMRCPDAPKCPIGFTPAVYDDVPCFSCPKECACKRAGEYETREAYIQLWWKKRQESAAWERKNWEDADEETLPCGTVSL